ncbi:MAG: hypothetical protein Q8P41_24725 [Pseudomonadota bacterium]|nr:hypothetical protein [Pseudomonadota bacterium]
MLTWWILGCALRGGAGHEVDLADLAPLAPAGLDALREEEHALAVARTLLAGARVEEERAADRIDVARARVRQVQLERDVAAANVDAAEASEDPTRRGVAAGRLKAYDQELRAAQAAERWQVSSSDAARAATRLAQARVELKQAELEMARLEVLEQNEQARGYSRSDFTEQLREAQQAYDKAQRDADKADEEAMRDYDRWRELEERPLG